MEKGFETLKEIDDYEMKNALTDEEWRALFERLIQIFFRIREWKEENKKLGLKPTISDNWTPQQRESFLRDWLDDSANMEASRNNEMMNEDPSDQVNEGASTSQAGRGEKRSHNEHILDDTVGDVPSHDQVRMIIHSTQLKTPISFPFKPAQTLTTERILSEVQRVVQSNQHFRLNDTVDVNVIHVSMPSGDKRGRRTEMSLEKHLEKKRSVIRIRNDDNLCMARELVVSKSKIDNDPQYKYVADHRKPMQTRMAPYQR